MSEKNEKNRILKALPLIFCLGLALPGCSASKDTPEPETMETGFVPALAGNYDSIDTALVVRKDVQASTITFLNTELGKKYTLNYDGATSYADKYSQPISLAQLETGTMVDVTFVHSRKRLNSLKVSAEAFVYDNVKGFSASDGGRNITLGGELYNLSRDLVVMTDTGEGELMDINGMDRLRITGIDHTVYGIVVEEGHAYLRLINSDYFNGGWVQIGDNLVSQIQPDMLLAIPEGDYPVTVSHKGSSGTENITAKEGQEISLDVSKWVSEPEYGSIIFTVIPEDARVYIDGEKTDTNDKVKLSYGIHQMVAAAEGYTTVSRYIKVGSELANLNIILEKDPNASASENKSTAEPSATPTPAPTEVPQGNTVEMIDVVATPTPTPTPIPPEDASAAAAVGEYRVYIDAPADVEVYKDGIYLGISPISFVREPGNYVITLRRSGYQTRSYTISVGAEESDLNYSFSELDPID
ncbi:MAG: PEGA domain-containing protein [Lachnospiraceae bacterium]|nr:PEGA domain-containing protein [Lachnospiraceae bacterium]